MKTVCFFGIYDRGYSRTRVLMRGFSENGWRVIECHADPRTRRGVRKYIDLIRAFRKLPHEKPDLVIVGFPGQTVVWLARLLFGKKIVFDAFLSLYDSNVFDRKVYGRRSVGALKDFFFDWYSVSLAGRVLLDTRAHIAYFAATFGARPDKFIRVLIGADDAVFVPAGAGSAVAHELRAAESEFVVEFHGTFIPLQGVEYIIDAARLLKGEKIRFDLIGSGQTFAAVKARAEEAGVDSVRFLGKVPFEEVPGRIAEADACIGIVGATEKTLRVIPNKVYECAALGKPIITADSPAMREVFTGGRDVLFCTAADASSLAAEIRRLMRDRALRAALAQNARATFERECAPAAIVRQLITDLHI